LRFLGEIQKNEPNEALKSRGLHIEQFGENDPQMSADGEEFWQND
jgi:hypothetical protein